MVLSRMRVALIGLAIVSILVLVACDSNELKEKKPGQALVSVNGKEVTTLQLNEEIKRANIRPGNYEVVSQQLLESLIVRQLIVDEAIRNKLDRTPDIMQARDRANAQAIAQAYMQGIANKVAKPNQMEINEYFQNHPEFFSRRKQFDLIIVRVATEDLSDELKKTIDAAKSLDQVVAWLDKNKLQYFRSLASRSSTDLPPQMAKMLQEKSKDTIFIVNEQEHSLLISVSAIKDSPVTLAMAAPQIERFLLNQKYKEATDAEIARLRAAAKIEYLSAAAPVSGVEKSVVPQVAPTTSPDITNNLKMPDPASESAIERGIMGLK